MNITPAQQDALLEAVWLIVVGVVELAPHYHEFRDSPEDANGLAAESMAVLASAITSEKPKAEDAVADDGPPARKVDS
jgi:hypothetical protein